MADNKKIIEGLQIIVTDLAQQADGHAIQSKIFAAQGFSKLGEKYAEHATEERGYVDKCIDRILDLGGEVKNEAKKEAPVYTDVIEWIKYDLQVSKDGLAWLKTLTEEARDDYTTYDILKEYLIPQNSKHCSESQKSVNPAITSSESKAEFTSVNSEMTGNKDKIINYCTNPAAFDSTMTNGHIIFP